MTADHGTTAGYSRHYRDHEPPCRPCQDAKNTYEKNRHRQVAYGRWDKWTDATPVREHVRALMAEGMGFRAIAKAAGTSYASTNYLLYGRGGKQPPKRTRPHIAAALLAVTPEPTRPVAIGTARRLRALQALGHTQAYLAKRLGTYQTLIWRWGTDAQVVVAKETAAKVAALYEELCMTPGLSARTRASALRKGWLPPLAYDDIDDPNECPQMGPSRNHTDPDSVDPTVVDRILGGEWRLSCTRAEKEAVSARFMGNGGSTKQLADRTHWKVERYWRRSDAA